MANFSQRTLNGQFSELDDVPPMDPKLGAAISTYSTAVSSNKQSYKWIQAVQWIENILFGLGRQYNDLLLARLSVNSDGTSSLVGKEFSKRIPQPVNDFVGRSVETNIALLTENRPQPRITAKSDSRDDRQKAELSQLVIEYLWEELGLPEKHREIARIIMYCGICFLETVWDETEPRHLAVQQTTTEPSTAISAGPGVTPINIPVERQVGVVDEEGRPVLRAQIEYGDIRSNVVSPFELHFPVSHSWEDIDWVMKETFVPMNVIQDRYNDPGLKKVCTKANGWDLSILDKLTGTNIQNLPLWWWERMTQVVEVGPGPSIYVGNPEMWDNYVIVKTFDRKPNPKWPNGRTCIVVGDQVLYDSPKKIGARAYDPRWPHRWHPYTRFRWEAQVGSIYGRSLVAKIVPKIKRINAIDTTLIMYGRTVPIATWIMPKGTSPVEDQHTGRPGSYIEYDPRKTNNQAPTPVHPTAYPDALLVARDMCKAEIEAMAGTEDVLRGQRPTGVNSAAMLDVLRKQALSSRSAILQAWDESLQHVGTSILQEVTKHVRGDSRYEERLKILSREKASRFTIKAFTGTDLSDNVVVRVDTASQAMVSKEAKQARAIEVMQYAPGLVALPVTLQAKLIEDLGWPDTMSPKSQDINRAQILLSFVKSNRFNLCVPFPEDDPYVLHEFLVEDMKSEGFIDYPLAQQQMIIKLIGLYQAEIERIEKQQIKMQMDLQQAQADAGGAPPAGGGAPAQ